MVLHSEKRKKFVPGHFYLFVFLFLFLILHQQLTQKDFDIVAKRSPRIWRQLIFKKTQSSLESLKCKYYNVNFKIITIIYYL